MATDQGGAEGRVARGEGMRAVIDAIEGAWARLAFDDGQCLDWPVDRLPPGAAQGTAVVLSLAGGQAADAQADVGTWAGVLAAPGKPGLWARIRRALGVSGGGQARARQAAGGEGTGPWIALGGQRLAWSDPGTHAVGDPVLVCMRADADDTERRQQHVQDLVDDLFG